MRYACRRVALPTQRTRSPVASGSRVPVWPAFFTFARRRNVSTTSWEVIPAFLSTSSTPSILGSGLFCTACSLDDPAQDANQLLLRLGHRQRNRAPGRRLLASATEHRGDLLHVDARLRAQGNTRRVAVAFLEQRRHQHAFDVPAVVDDPLGVFG